jgi:hypothetical protein
MRNLLKTLIIAGVVASAATSAAVARDYPVSPQQQRAERSFEYWNKKNTDSSPARGERQMSDAAASPKVSQYPCGKGCVYSHELGGYVQKHYGNR